jgi:hypothetical protein
LESTSDSAKPCRKPTLTHLAAMLPYQQQQRPPHDRQAERVGRRDWGGSHTKTKRRGVEARFLTALSLSFVLFCLFFLSEPTFATTNMSIQVRLSSHFHLQRPCCPW